MTAASLTTMASPAEAEQLTIADPAGDAQAGGLDITGVHIRNRDHAILSTVTFVRDRPGLVIAAVKVRRGPFLRVVSEHRSSGADSVVLVNRRGREVPCGGLTSEWDRSAATVQLRLPSRCVNDGNYGAIRSPWTLIESLGSSNDVDLARTKRWISRG
jgi:hypothetical protein